jgi:crotonobetainyl-CoA:carnitine CoA-transferase CaiB-like acyl-CoA transferase
MPRTSTSPATAARTLPLAGVRIVELANVVAGPSVGKHLSDFGAEVIKVERPGEGDTSRSMGSAIGSRSAWWLTIGRNKRSVALDLKHPKGREALLRVAEDADALVESFRPGVLERLGLAPQTLHEVNPGLVIVRISAFGQTGPYSERPGFGTLAEAFSGLAAITGYPDRPPLVASFALADEVAGLYATWALLAALYHRDVAGGDGQTIDVSLYEAVLSILGPLPTLYRHRGEQQERMGSRLPWSSPRNVYRTRDGRHFAVSGTATSAARTIMRVVGGDALADDPRFATTADRAAHADELDAIVAAWMAERDLAEVEERFERAGAAGIRVLRMADAFDNPHYKARETIAQVADDELGEVAMTAPVPRMSATPGRIAHAGRDLGGDTDAILASLGYGSDEIARHRRDGAW